MSQWNVSTALPSWILMLKVGVATGLWMLSLTPQMPVLNGRYLEVLMETCMDYGKPEYVPLTANFWCSNLQNDAILIRILGAF